MYATRCLECFAEKSDARICSTCGFDERVEESPIRLPRRHVLNQQYLLGKVLGKPGGFGISYLALDLHLNIKLAIKEFFPTHLIARAQDGKSVVPNDPKQKDIYHEGLQGFLKEAQTLARFDHANVVRVRNYFEANGTAYLVMDYYEGLNISEWMHTNGLFSEQSAIQLMMPILDGLREVHRSGILHRDIKPENIYIAQNNRPILLDFGAARAAVGAKSQNMSVVLTPGFAPMEQYAASGKQGAWTDIYACGATLYYMVTGRIPIEAMDRLDEDALPSPQQIRPEISKTFSDILLNSLALKPEARPQTILAFQDALLALLQGKSSDEILPQMDAKPEKEVFAHEKLGAPSKTMPLKKPLRTMTCSSCNGINEIPEGGLLDQMRCGNEACGMLLLPRPSIVVRCSNASCQSLNRVDATVSLALAQCGKCQQMLSTHP